jgi:hypothetical protein
MLVQMDPESLISSWTPCHNLPLLLWSTRRSNMSAPHSTWFAAVSGLLTRRRRSIRHRTLCSRPKGPFPPRVIDRTYPVLAS